MNNNINEQIIKNALKKINIDQKNKPVCCIVGPTGPQGLPGATIKVNKTITGKPKTEASVTNVGTDNNVLLDFTIPQGESPTLEIGTVITGAPGTQASVKITQKNNIDN